MNLVQISKNKLINPDMIAYVETRNTKNGLKTVINVGGRDHMADMPMDKIHNDLINAGVTFGDQFFRG